MQNELNHKEDAAKIEIVDVTHSKKNTFVLTQEERAEIEQEKHHYEDPRAASIEALKIVQKNRGWVEDGAIYAIADVLGIPASDVEGVATFYSQIFRQPVSAVTLFVFVTVWFAILQVIKAFRQLLRSTSISFLAKQHQMVVLPYCQPVV